MSVEPLTRSQCRFMVMMEKQYGECNALRMGEQKPKRKRRTKAEMQADKEASEKEKPEQTEQKEIEKGGDGE